MTTLVVINPNCRNGDAEFGDILEALLPLGQLATHRIGKDGSLQEQIESLGDSLDRIVIGGGDGTLNHLLEIALQAQVPVGVLPLGTANDFARSLDIPGNPVKAAQLIAEGHTRQVDVGVVNGHYFLNAVGIGLGPELTRKLDQQQKKRLGVLAYLENLIHAFGNSARRYATIKTTEREEHESFLQVTIANGPYYGGGMMVSDEVQLDDGLLHILCVRPLKPMELFLRGIRLRFGSVDNDDKLLYLQSDKVTVSTRRQAEVTADGELITQTPIEAYVLPKALSVHVAARTAEDTADEVVEAPLLERAS
ncbi:MAG: YegS/Rv2252/BmrU family lipid kinase [Gammaproteobacteria bacterium]|nr:YegS/Rv2252/BmrU family lipid kinase [Gammaproteobacteria bacterium]NND60633.1 YegS/Rv2252/BmrU family lipid kinase [Gammaproteobacteria bacterium]